MSRPFPLTTFLRTPRGVVALLGGSLAFTLLLAVIVASQRARFEGLVREKLEPPDVHAAALVSGRDPEAELRTLRALDASRHRQAYESYLQGPGRWHASAPALLLRSAPALYRDFAARTLLVGSGEQRRRVVDFLGASRHPVALPLLEAEAARARRRGEGALEAAALKAIEACRSRRASRNNVPSTGARSPGNPERRDPSWHAA